MENNHLDPQQELLIINKLDDFQQKLNKRVRWAIGIIVTSALIVVGANLKTAVNSEVTAGNLILLQQKVSTIHDTYVDRIDFYDFITMIEESLVKELVYEKKTKDSLKKEIFKLKKKYEFIYMNQKEQQNNIKHNSSNIKNLYQDSCKIKSYVEVSE